MRKILFSIFFSFLIALPVSAAGGSITLTASKTSIAVGDTVTVQVRAGSNGTEINTIGSDVNYPSNLLQEMSISGSSVITYSITKGVASPGLVSIQGGILPAVVLNNTAVGTISFRALAPGTATVSVAGSSGIYANDGNGTDVLSSRGSVKITIASAQIPNSNSQIPNTTDGNENTPIVAVPINEPPQGAEQPRTKNQIPTIETVLQAWLDNWGYPIAGGAAVFLVILGIYFVIRSFIPRRKK